MKFTIKTESEVKSNSIYVDKLSLSTLYELYYAQWNWDHMSIPYPHTLYDLYKELIDDIGNVTIDSYRSEIPSSIIVKACNDEIKIVKNKIHDRLKTIKAEIQHLKDEYRENSTDLFYVANKSKSTILNYKNLVDEMNVLLTDEIFHTAVDDCHPISLEEMWKLSKKE